MAVQAQSTSDNLTMELWDEDLQREIPKESFFESWMSDDGSNIIHVKDATDQKGDTVTFGLLMRISQVAKHAGEALEGSEATMDSYSVQVALDEQNFAVRTRSLLDEKRPVWDMPKELRRALIINAAEQRDQLCFTKLFTGTLSKIVYGGSATSIATLTTSDKLTPELISRVKAAAKNGWNRTQAPLRPLMIKGKEHFVLLTHNDSFYDLMQDSRFDQARREAMMRADDHPLFAGADTMLWDGVIIKCHENVPIALTGGAGANVPYVKNVFLGAQALCFAWGKKEKIVTETFNYTTQTGYASIAIYNAVRSTFNSKDYGAVGIFTARTSISDA